MKQKKPPYEKPLLEPLLIVAQGVVPVCSSGSLVDGSCSANGAAATVDCSTGTLVQSG